MREPTNRKQCVRLRLDSRVARGCRAEAAIRGIDLYVLIENALRDALSPQVRSAMGITAQPSPKTSKAA